MTPEEAKSLRRLAEKIAARLFTNGQGQIADRLKLVTAGAERDLGGWGLKPAIDQIERVLVDELEEEGS